MTQIYGMKGKWWEIKEEIKEAIDADGFRQKWVLDPAGYFLIRINPEQQMIEVGHCTNEHKLIRIIKGKTPEEIMYKIIDEGWVSLLDHAAYLGKELQKASIALHYNFKYCQDSELSAETALS
ncbi:DUF4346 domain-containing protein [Candidatus Woesearchaeota archaeon]|nr:DUF4346 domain-containing protein [Candidatus Woesearchaeota archaeon]